MYNYILNPIDKKKINIKSKLGKKILQNYLELLGGSSSMPWHRTKAAKKGKKKVSLPSLEKIDREETLPDISESQKLCSIKGLEFCKYFVPGFYSPFNILNYISHNEDGELNDINFEKTLYKRLETKDIGKSGRYGGIVDNIFENENTKNQIRISEKIIHSDLASLGYKLEEINLLTRYPNLSELCPHIIPIKILDDKIYMLRGNGDLSNLINNPLINIDAETAEQIVNCVKETLLCLLANNIYYFDLKPSNILFQCVDSIMYIWLIDLGSMVPDKLGRYSATYPHPIINNKSEGFGESGLITRTVMGKNLRTEDLHERVKNIYAYQLSQLFFNLIGLNKEFHYKTINKKDSFGLILDLHVAIKKLEDKRYEPILISKYIGVFKEIINYFDKKSRSVNYTNLNHKNFWK